MKFASFALLRQRLLDEGIINESVKSFKEYADAFEAAAIQHAVESTDPLAEMSVDLQGISIFEDSRLDEAADSSSNVFKNIIGFMRIKGLANKYIKSMVDEGVADMDYERRRAAAGKNAETADKEKLKTAHAAKKSALTDRTSAIGEKIDEIATTEFLKKVAKRTKLSARIKKNEIILKVASKEEAKELRLKNSELNQELAAIDGELRDYQKDNQKEIDDAKKEAAKKIKEEISKKEESAKAIKAEIEEIQGEKSNEAEETTDGEADDKAKKIEKLAKAIDLKVKLVNLLEEIASLKKSYNESIGEDEYSVESDEKEAENLAASVKEDQERKEKLESKDKSDKEEPAKDAEEEPAKDAEEEPEEDAEIKKIKEKIAEYESAIDELQAKKGKSKSDNEKIGVLTAALNSEKKRLEKAKEKKSAES